MLMMIIFILLGILVFLVKKYSNNKFWKRALFLVIILFTLYSIIFSVDYNRVSSLKEPIFTRENGYLGSMTRYDGLGYVIGLEKDAATGKISQSQMTMFGIFIVGAIE